MFEKMIQSGLIDYFKRWIPPNWHWKSSTATSGKLLGSPNHCLYEQLAGVKKFFNSTASDACVTPVSYRISHRIAGTYAFFHLMIVFDKIAERARPLRIKSSQQLFDGNAIEIKASFKM
jgi:hypothetical protein